MRAPASNLHWINEHLTRQRVTLLDRLDLDLPEERQALLDGLYATPATIAPKYFYDAEGSALFEAICALPEYYPTRTERSILTDAARRNRASRRKTQATGGSRRGRLRQGRAADAGARAAALCRCRHRRGGNRSRTRATHTEVSRHRTDRTRDRFFAATRPGRGHRLRRGDVFLPGLEHRQFRARGRARIPATRYARTAGSAAAC